VSTCKRCGREILWGRSEHSRDENGKRRWIPIDPEPHPLGVIDLRDGKTAVFAGATQDPEALRYLPHEASCTDPYRPTHPRNKEGSSA